MGACDPSVTHLALRLLILTGVRSKPIRFLHLEQIVDDVWTVPAVFMKGRRDATSDFRVPLVPEALAVLAQARRQWAVHRARYMTLKTMAALSDDAIVSLPVVAR